MCSAQTETTLTVTWQWTHIFKNGNVLIPWSGNAWSKLLAPHPSHWELCAWTHSAVLGVPGHCQELPFPCCSHGWSCRQIPDSVFSCLVPGDTCYNSQNTSGSCGELPDYLSPINRTAPHLWGWCKRMPVFPSEQHLQNSCWHFAGCISLVTFFSFCQEDFFPPSLQMARCCYHPTHVPAHGPAPGKIQSLLISWPVLIFALLFN